MSDLTTSENLNPRPQTENESLSILIKNTARDRNENNCQRAFDKLPRKLKEKFDCLSPNYDRTIDVWQALLISRLGEDHPALQNEGRINLSTEIVKTIREQGISISDPSLPIDRLVDVYIKAKNIPLPETLAGKMQRTTAHIAKEHVGENARQLLQRFKKKQVISEQPSTPTQEPPQTSPANNTPQTSLQEPTQPGQDFDLQELFPGIPMDATQVFSRANVGEPQALQTEPSPIDQPESSKQPEPHQSAIPIPETSAQTIPPSEPAEPVIENPAPSATLLSEADTDTIVQTDNGQTNETTTRMSQSDYFANRYQRDVTWRESQMAKEGSAQTATESIPNSTIQPAIQTKEPQQKTPATTNGRTVTQESNAQFKDQTKAAAIVPTRSESDKWPEEAMDKTQIIDLDSLPPLPRAKIQSPDVSITASQTISEPQPSHPEVLAPSTSAPTHTEPAQKPNPLTPSTQEIRRSNDYSPSRETAASENLKPLPDSLTTSSQNEQATVFQEYQSQTGAIEDLKSAVRKITPIPEKPNSSNVYQAEDKPSSFEVLDYLKEATRTNQAEREQRNSQNTEPALMNTIAAEVEESQALEESIKERQRTAKQLSTITQSYAQREQPQTDTPKSFSDVLADAGIPLEEEEAFQTMESTIASPITETINTPIKLKDSIYAIAAELKLTESKIAELVKRVNNYLEREEFKDSPENKKNGTVLSKEDLITVFKDVAANWQNVNSAQVLNKEKEQRVLKHLSENVFKSSNVSPEIQRKAVQQLLTLFENEDIKEKYPDIAEYLDKISINKYYDTSININGQLHALLLSFDTLNNITTSQTPEEKSSFFTRIFGSKKNFSLLEGKLGIIEPENTPQSASRREFIKTASTVAGIAVTTGGLGILGNKSSAAPDESTPTTTPTTKPTETPRQATSTPIPSATSSPSATPFPSATPSPSVTPSPTATATETETPKPSPTATATETPKPTATSEPLPPAEVKETGRRFEKINIGFNIPNLAYLSDAEQDIVLQEVAGLKGNVIRIFIANCTLPDEKVAESLHKLLEKGQKYGVSFVVSTLNWYVEQNNYPYTPDVSKYIEQYYSPAKSGGTLVLNHNFYVNGYREEYFKYLKTLVNRNKDASNIYSWEIGNELRIEDTNGNVIDHGHRKGDFMNFLNQTSKLIKSIDPKHAVSTGFLRATHALDEDDKEPNPKAVENLYSRLPDVDIVSVVSYNNDFKGSADVEVAKKLGKKTMVSEMGYGSTECFACPQKQPVTNRSGRYAEGFYEWEQQGVETVNVWAFVPKGIRHDTGFLDRAAGFDAVAHDQDYESLAWLILHRGAPTPENKEKSYPPNENLGIRNDIAKLMPEAKRLGATSVRIDMDTLDVNNPKWAEHFKPRFDALAQAQNVGLKVLAQYNAQRLVEKEQIRQSLYPILSAAKQEMTIEIGNEPDHDAIPYWKDHDLNTFAAYVARAIQAVTEIDNEIKAKTGNEKHTKIVIGALVNPNNAETFFSNLKKQMEDLRQKGFDYDMNKFIFAVHAYHNTQDIERRVNTIRNAMKKVFGDELANKISLMFTEIGVYTDNMNNANDLTNMYALARKESKNQPVFLHELPNTERMGLVNPDTGESLSIYDAVGKSIDQAEKQKKS